MTIEKQKAIANTLFHNLPQEVDLHEMGEQALYIFINGRWERLGDLVILRRNYAIFEGKKYLVLATYKYVANYLKRYETVTNSVWADEDYMVYTVERQKTKAPA